MSINTIKGQTNKNWQNILASPSLTVSGHLFVFVCTETMQQLQLQLMESDRRTTSYMRKFNRAQADYHKLIVITADLVDNLEANMSGKMVSQVKCSVNKRTSRGPQRLTTRTHTQ